MLQQLRGRGNIWLAFIAACLFVFQFANSSNAAPSQIGLDAFGNPLCLSSTHHDAKDTAPASDHSGMPECCTMACGVFAYVAFPGKLAYAFEGPFPAPSDRIVARDDANRFRLLEEFQGSARAPPRLS